MDILLGAATPVSTTSCSPTMGTSSSGPASACSGPPERSMSWTDEEEHPLPSNTSGGKDLVISPSGNSNTSATGHHHNGLGSRSIRDVSRRRRLLDHDDSDMEDVEEEGGSDDINDEMTGHDVVPASVVGCRRRDTDETSDPVTEDVDEGHEAGEDEEDEKPLSLTVTGKKTGFSKKMRSSRESNASKGTANSRGDMPAPVALTSPTNGSTRNGGHTSKAHRGSPRTASSSSSRSSCYSPSRSPLMQVCNFGIILAIDYSWSGFPY